MSLKKQVVCALAVSLWALVPEPVRAAVVPKAFTALEEATENISESAAAPARLKAALAALKVEQPKALAELVRVGAPSAIREGLSHALNDLHRAAEKGDTNATARVATDVLLAVADGIDAFKPARPGDVLRLDSLAMCIPLDLAARQGTDAANHARKLAEVWERLRPRVPETARVARDAFSAEVGRLLEALAAGRDEAAVASARAIEELVDKLEEAFPAW